MRVLLVGGAPVEGTSDLLKTLASAHQYLLGVDGGAAVLRDAGLPVDLIVGDMDSLSSAALGEFASAGVEVRSFPKDKGMSDLDLALAAARARGAASVTVSGALAGRLDHTLATVGSLARAADVNPEIAEPGLRGWILDARHRSELSLSGLSCTVSIFAILGEATVSCEGFRWPLVKHQIEPLQTLGLSNVITAEDARIEIHEGCIAVLSSSVNALGPASAAPLCQE